MAYAFVQFATQASGSVAAVPVTLPATVGVGNFVCGNITFDTGGGSLVSVTDDKGNNYTPGPRIDIVGDGQGHATFYLWNITNAPKTITANFTAPVQFNQINAAEYSGVATAADPKDIQEGRVQLSPGTGTDAVASSAGGTATNAANELVVGFSMNDSTTNISGGTGFNFRGNGTAWTGALALEDKDSGASGTATRATFSSIDGASSDFSTILVTFKIPSAAPGGGDPYSFNHRMGQPGYPMMGAP